MADARGGRVAAVGPYELWMLAHAAVGFCGVGGMMFLIPAYVLEQGGTPGDAGAVMALAGALALAGPFIGSTADRFRAHRSIQLTSLVLLALAGVSFAAAKTELLWLVAGALLGLGMAGLSVVNATFVVGAGFDESRQARKLSLLQLSLPSGQVLGLAAMSALAAAGLSFEARFLFLSAVGVLLAVIVALVNGPASRRVLPAAAPTASSPAGERLGLRQLLASQFGVVLALVVLIMVSAQAIESQYPAYMQGAFGIDTAASAGALSIIVLLSIPLYVVVGRWTARSGPRVPFILSAAARAAAGAGLLLLPSDAGLAALVVFGVVMLVYPLFELNAATLAAVTSPIGPGGGQGAVGAAMALGTIIAAVLAGWLAENLGFPTLAVVTLVAGGAATVLALVALRPVREAPAVEDAPA